MTRRKVPCALTIAGSDSGGGAGIQADLKTFAALGVHGTAAITCLTAQNPKEILSVQAASPESVRDQIEAVLTGLPPAAIKTGMLYAVEIIEAVADVLKSTKAPLIIDPVMISTSGTGLLRPGAVESLRENLFPRAELITPNLTELEFLLNTKIKNPEELRSAARAFYAQYRAPVLAKGGHLRGREAIDFFFDGRNELILSARRISGVSTHGTGCTYSAAITSFRARGLALEKSVIAGKNFISEAIMQSYRCGRHFVLGIE